MKDQQIILIAGPSESYHSWLAVELRNAPGFRLAGATDDGDQLMKLISAVNPDAVVLNPTLNILYGEDLLIRILALERKPLVLLSDEPPDGSMREFLLSDAPVFYRRSAYPSALFRELKLLLDLKGDHADPSIPLKREIEGVLVALGVSNGTDCFRCLRDAVFLIRKGNWPTNFQPALTACLAERYGVPVYVMYNSIRTGVRQAYENGETALSQTYLGSDFFRKDKKPSSRLFIRSIADSICAPDTAASLNGRSADRYSTVTAGLEQKTDAVLGELALPETMRGTRLLRDALLLYMSDTFQVPSLPLAFRRTGQQSGTKGPYVAMEISQVVSYLNGNRNNPVLKTYFGPAFASGTQDPDNRTLISMLADQIRRSDTAGQPEPAEAAAIREATVKTPAAPFGPVPRAVIVIRDLGLSEDTQEGHILTYILNQCLQKKTLSPELTAIYDVIAEKAALSYSTVRKVVQATISQVLTTCSDPVLNRYFGTSCASRTLNLRASVFFSMLASRVRIEDKGDPLYVQTADTLNQFGLCSALTGYFYLLEGILLYLESASSLEESWFTQLLSVIAKRHFADPHGVLLSMQKAIGRASETWDDRFAETSFGPECVAQKAPPSPALVIVTIANRIRPQPGLVPAAVAARAESIATSEPQPSPDSPVKEPEDSVEKALLELSIIPTSKAYRNLREIMDLCLQQDPQEAFTLQDLTDSVAEKLALDGVTVRATSRAAIASAFPKWSDRLRTKYFGLCFAAQNSVPDISRFLATVTERIRMQNSPWGPETRTREMLLDLGFDPSDRGYQYLLDVIVQCLQSDGGEAKSLKFLFGVTATRHSVLSRNVPATIRSAIRHTCALWPEPFLAALFGQAIVSRKEAPSPAQFIKAVVRKIRAEISLEAKVPAILQDLGFSAERASCRYLPDAVILYLRGEAMEESELYQTIADRHAVSADTVRGALEEAVEGIVTRCSTETAIRYFGPQFIALFYPDEGELSVLSFIAGIADWLQRTCSEPSMNRLLKEALKDPQPAETAINRTPSDQTGGDSEEEGRSTPEGSPAGETEHEDRLLNLIRIVRPKAVLLNPVLSARQELPDRIRSLDPGPLVLLSSFPPDRIEIILTELKAPRDRKAFSYLHDAILLVLEHPQESFTTKQLFERVAKQTGKAVSTLHLMLPDIIRRSLADASDQVLEKYFGAGPASRRKIPCLDYITMIAERIRLEQTAEGPDQSPVGTSISPRKAGATDRFSQMVRTAHIPECRKVLLGEPSKQICARYRDSFRSEHDFALCGVTDNGWKLLNLIHSASPDTVILNPTLNGLHGQALLDGIAALERVPAVLLSSLSSLSPKIRIEAVLTELNVSCGKKVFSCLRDIILMVYRDQKRELVFSLEQAVQPVAEANGIAVSSALTQISSATSAVWKNASVRSREKYFGAAFASREAITCSSFISLLAVWMRLEDSPVTPETRVERVLLDLGFDPSRNPYCYLRDVICQCLRQEAASRITLKPLYAMIAKRYYEETSTVENAIRHGIRNAWPMRTDKAVEKYFGPSFAAGKNSMPTNLQFVSAITAWIRQNTQTPTPDHPSEEAQPCQNPKTAQ